MSVQVKLAIDAVMEMAGSLRDVLPLGILPEADRRELASEMRVRRFGAGEVVYHRGDHAADSYVVYEGLVKVMLLNDDGHEALVALHGRGEMFGELALFGEKPRDATVIAVMPTTLLQMSRESCTRVLGRNPPAREWMFHHLSEVIERLADKYETLVFLDVPGRLAKYLLELDRARQELPITQDDLAAAIGSTRVTVNKVLADFEHRGLIHVDRRRVEIRQPALLGAELQR